MMKDSKTIYWAKENKTENEGGKRNEMTKNGGGRWKEMTRNGGGTRNEMTKSKGIQKKIKIWEKEKRGSKIAERIKRALHIPEVL